MDMTPILRRTILWVSGLLAAFFIISNLWIWSAGWGRDLRNTPDQIPQNSVLVLLGVNERDEKTGKLSECFKLRIEAAAQLCRTGKIKLVVTSGLNNQARTMADRLQEAGVTTPIVLDPYGWRTLDSVKRAAAVFPYETIIYVSQGWHCDRALWLSDRISNNPAKSQYEEVLSYSADFGHEPTAYFNLARDFLAKPKAVIDWLTGSKVTTTVDVADGYKVYP
jgi:SanA protein